MHPHLASLAFVVAAILPGALNAAPATLRVDIQHGGDIKTEHYSLERVMVEALPWAGNLARPLDDSNRGANFFEVIDSASGKVLYSRGYSTIFAEWRTTDDAKETQRSFQESLRFPMPEKPVQVRISTRDAGNKFVPVWSVSVDPRALDVERVQWPAPAKPIAIHNSGDPANKVDLLILGDGYAAEDLAKFEADARKLSTYLFSVSPFKERKGDFNVWALTVPVPVSGANRPSLDIHRASATGLRYDIFGSERYALTLDNRAFRDLAQYAPYDVVEIVFNGKTYGGGGIFGQFSTAAADSDWTNYLFVHEFGHHFAALADEYYTSPAVYAPSDSKRIEPWEPNVTALLDPSALKWKGLMSPATPLPTPWPKAEFEAYQRDNQARRVKLRKDRRPESEMSALFTAEQAYSDGLFAKHPQHSAIGAFEGAMYESTGYYRSQMQCLMFTRSDEFCRVCHDAIEDIIDLYSKSSP
ncbi:MAG: peptidase M64 [Gammaproteobacteria bacterium RIFCSPHIGHO2_12_FULL_63_22]|nr:MAG: peptidase M64 [Gammaproteobacteria bacterium RIFCSPHIGHO2_12_FULL_63_22]